MGRRSSESPRKRTIPCIPQTVSPALSPFPPAPAPEPTPSGSRTCSPPPPGLSPAGSETQRSLTRRRPHASIDSAATQKVYRCPDSRGLRGPAGARRRGFSLRVRPRGRREGGRRDREWTRAAGKVLTVKQTASIDHVCSLHQRLRSPLIPFRDGKTSSGGGGRSRGVLKVQTKNQMKGGQRGERERSEPTQQQDPNPGVRRARLALARSLTAARPASPP